MTRKDFQAIARVLKTHRDAATTHLAADTIASAAREMANYFATANPRFDRAQFLDACGCEAA